MNTEANVQEIWKDIPNYKGFYQVSNLGNVKSIERLSTYKDGRKKYLKERFLKSSSDTNGYLKVTLCKKGKRKTLKIHKLVAITFLNHVPCGFKIVIDHINNTKTDNQSDNLQLISSRENASKDKKGGTSKYIGVSWSKVRKNWVANIKINGKSKYLGCFINEYDAHIAYQNALKNLINGK